MIDTSCFPSEKIINITSANYFSAFRELARLTLADTQAVLEYYQKQPNYHQLISQSQKYLLQLLRLRSSNQSCFTTSDGVNHLENYLACFVGFCQGSQIGLEEGTLLQLELEAGCQSLTVKNHQTGQITGFHTEEDMTAYDRFGQASHGKYWVNLTLNSRHFDFLYYAGLCGFGYSSTITDTLFNTCDVLTPIPSGWLWANAVNFMIMDCQNLKLVQELVAGLSTLPHPQFIGGYTLTLVTQIPSPDMIQIEFGGDKIIFIPPFVNQNYSFFTGTNYPHDLQLQSIDEGSVYEELTTAYTGRFNRLVLAASQIAAGTSSAAALQNPDGEWREDWFTGFSNSYVANHSLFTISPSGNLEVKLVDGSPRPTHSTSNHSIGFISSGSPL